MSVAEGLKCRELDHGFHFALEQYWQHDDVIGFGFAQARTNVHIIRRDIGDQDALLFERALAHQAFARVEFIRQILALVVGIAAQQFHDRLAIIAGVHVKDALLGFDQRSKFRKDHLRDRLHIALALQHPGEAGQVGFQPVLLSVFLGGVLEIQNHLVDIVFQRGHLALGFHGDRSRQIALGHRRRNFGDRPHLIRQVCSQTVDVVSQIAPSAGRTRNVRLPAQLAFDADLARDRSHLIGKDCQRVGHVVDGIGQLGNFTFSFDCQLAFEIAIGHGGNYASNTPHLIS